MDTVKIINDSESLVDNRQIDNSDMYRDGKRSKGLDGNRIIPLSDDDLFFVMFCYVC